MSIKKEIRILFAGTADFSLPSLEYISKNYNLVGILTKPDKPIGRGLKIRYSKVKEFGIANNIPVFQPEKLNVPSFMTDIMKIKPHFIIDVAYGKIFPPELLNIPSECCINIHPSLLPGYRGPSPIRWALINDEKRTGVTAHIMTEQIDTGKIILQSQIDILNEDDYGTLYNKLSIEAAKMVPKIISRYFQNDFLTEVADTYRIKNFYARKLEHNEFRIGWAKTSKEIYNLIRAASPQPGAFTFYNKKIIKIYKAEIVNDAPLNYSSGEIVDVDIKKGIFVKTQDGILRILRLQKENRNILHFKDFLNGTNIKVRENFY